MHIHHYIVDMLNLVFDIFACINKDYLMLSSLVSGIDSSSQNAFCTDKP